MEKISNDRPLHEPIKRAWTLVKFAAHANKKRASSFL